MVQAPFLADLELLLPALLVEGRRAGQRVDAAVERTAQEDPAAVDFDMVPGPHEVAQAKLHRAEVLAAAHDQGLQVRGELVPELGVLAVQGIFDHRRVALQGHFLAGGGAARLVDQRDLGGLGVVAHQHGAHPGLPGRGVGIHVHLRDLHRLQRRQGDLAEHAVPDDLGVVGVGVGQQRGVHVVALAVVDAEHQLVPARGQALRDQIAVRRGQALLGAGHRLSVHPDGAGPDHALQLEGERLAGHRRRDRDVALVEGSAEEGMLARQALDLRAGDGGLQRVRRPQAGVVRRAGQVHRLEGGQAVQAHLPGAGQIQGIVPRRTGDGQQHEGGKENGQTFHIFKVRFLSQKTQEKFGELKDWPTFAIPKRRTR